jgi:hypothetical protein
MQLTVMALGFPPFQGGVLTYADRRGADEVLSSMKALYALCPWCVSYYVLLFLTEGPDKLQQLSGRCVCWWQFAPT